jgi:hypothetical protein
LARVDFDHRSRMTLNFLALKVLGSSRSKASTPLSSGGYDQQPQSASVRTVSTANGSMIAGVTWQNGFGGAEGSIADRVMRKGLSQAASGSHV